MQEEMSLKDKIIVTACFIGIVILFFSGIGKDPMLDKPEVKRSCVWRRVPNVSENMEICK